MMDERVQISFIRRCVSDILNGLSEGLSHFSMAASRAAVLFAPRADGPVLLCDPQDLLAGHEPIFKNLYIDHRDWRDSAVARMDRRHFADITPMPDPGLAGLLTSGGYSGSVFFQQWFTEHHPDICSPGPTERWLEHAVLRFSHDLANGQDLYTGISGHFLKEYATHAVRDFILDRMNVLIGWDSALRIYPILDVVLMISETREEGFWPVGRLLFVDPGMVGALRFFVRFQQDARPRLLNIKHVRKLLLTVERSARYLVSDGQSILGICGRELPAFALCADFRGRHGFLTINGEKICSFADGRFSSTTYQTQLVHLEELLLESSLEAQAIYFLMRTVTSLVRHAQRRKYGCAIVIDLNADPVPLSGQILSPPLDLREPYMLEVAKSLTRVDGALHIGSTYYLLSFASLLDGKSFPGENLARGARYNSALRFTAEHAHIIVVAVSSDRPVSVIHDGMESHGVCEWRHSASSIYDLERLDTWAAR